MIGPDIRHNVDIVIIYMNIYFKSCEQKLGGPLEECVVGNTCGETGIPRKISV